MVYRFIHTQHSSWISPNPKPPPAAPTARPSLALQQHAETTGTLPMARPDAMTSTHAVPEPKSTGALASGPGSIYLRFPILFDTLDMKNSTNQMMTMMMMMLLLVVVVVAVVVAVVVLLLLLLFLLLLLLLFLVLIIVVVPVLALLSLSLIFDIVVPTIIVSLTLTISYSYDIIVIVILLLLSLV